MLHSILLVVVLKISYAGSFYMDFQNSPLQNTTQQLLLYSFTIVKSLISNLMRKFPMVAEYNIFFNFIFCLFYFIFVFIFYFLFLIFFYSSSFFLVFYFYYFCFLIFLKVFFFFGSFFHFISIHFLK